MKIKKCKNKSISYNECCCRGKRGKRGKKGERGRQGSPGNFDPLLFPVGISDYDRNTYLIADSSSGNLNDLDILIGQTSNGMFIQGEEDQNNLNNSLPIDSTISTMMFLSQNKSFVVGTSSDEQWLQIGEYSSLFGRDIIAKEAYSFVSGYKNESYGEGTLISGKGNIVYSSFSSVGGEGCTVGSPLSSTNLNNYKSNSKGKYSKVFGKDVHVDSQYSAGYGQNNIIKEYSSHSLIAGQNNIIKEYSSHSLCFGQNNTIRSDENIKSNHSLCYGQDNTIFEGSKYSTCSGLKNNIDIISQYSICYGESNNIHSYSEHSVCYGESNNIYGPFSLCLGRKNILGVEHSVVGYSICLGENNTIGEKFSICVGQSNVVDGSYSSCFGDENKVYGTRSSCFGNGNVVNGRNSLCSGNSNFIGTEDNKVNDHGSYSSCSGQGNKIRGSYSLCTGRNLETSGEGQVIVGKHCTPPNLISNDISTDYSFSLGGGISKLDSGDYGTSVMLYTKVPRNENPDGVGLAKEWITTGVNITSEYMEWDDIEELNLDDQRGYFVKYTFNYDNKLTITLCDNNNDVVGITSPQHVGCGSNHDMFTYSHKLLKDEFGEIIRKESYVSSIITILDNNNLTNNYLNILPDLHSDEDNEDLIEIFLNLFEDDLKNLKDDPINLKNISEDNLEKYKKIIKIIKVCKPTLVSVLDPNYNPEREYISRDLRKEWVNIGTKGKVHVRDNGNCIVGEYCDCGEGCIAVPGNIYRVLMRTGLNVIVILLK